MFYLLMASYQIWRAGSCYGPRHIVPTVPLLLASLTMLPGTAFYRNVAGKMVPWELVALSVAVNGLAVFCYDHFWDANPYQKLLARFWF